MKRFLLVFILCFVATLAMVHVDRQCAIMAGRPERLTASFENIIEKWGRLL